MANQKQRWLISARLVGMKGKRLGMTVLSLIGIIAVLYGAYPIFAPFVGEIFPEIAKGVMLTDFDNTSILYIVGGSVLVFLST